ncbi:hypothetical protein F2P81_020748 [Scophthalmus maximus]|uniref:Uncharacterized protein n=1 Tax=Scophthalmus maximus TaxID=52904 RepID=A0A6A4S4A4_SCOMX|nr:hypothetical protein F2P81_020748 [Scophthalmus maximus]
MVMNVIRETERLPTQGGRERLLSPEQETEIMNMVLENNAITLRQIQRKIIENNEIFLNIDRKESKNCDITMYNDHSRSISDIVMCVSESVSSRRLQRHQVVFIDEVGFNLTKDERVEGISSASAEGTSHVQRPHHHAALGPYNTAHPITLLDADTTRSSSRSCDVDEVLWPDPNTREDAA